MDRHAGYEDDDQIKLLNDIIQKKPDYKSFFKNNIWTKKNKT